MSIDSLLCSIPGENTPLPVFEKIVRLPSGGVSYGCSNPAHFAEHTDPHFKIAIPFEGASIHTTWQTASGQRKQNHVRQGHVSILPANLPHETTLENRLEMIVVNLEASLIEEVAEELVGTVEIIENWTARDVLIRQLGLELRQEFQHGSPRLLYVESAVNILATHLVRHYSASRVHINNLHQRLSAQKLKQVTDYTSEHLEENITLAELGFVVQMSQYRFARAFKLSTGYSPHQYLMQQRIERAKHLLSQTKIPIVEISYKLGFSSQSHFTSAFHRVVGVTPKNYRSKL